MESQPRRGLHKTMEELILSRPEDQRERLREHLERRRAIIRKEAEELNKLSKEEQKQHFAKLAQRSLDLLAK